MKIIIAYMFFLTLCLQGFGQKKDTINSKMNYHGFNIGLLQTVQSGYGANYFANYTLQKNKSIYSVGFLFSPGLHLQSNSAIFMPFEPYKLNGAHISYTIFPNGSLRTFNLFFQLDFTLINHIGKDYIDDPLKDNQTIYARRTIFSNFISYGIRINITKYAYLYNSIGIGYNRWYGKFQYENNTERKYKSLYSGDAMIKIGIGFKI